MILHTTPDSLTDEKPVTDLPVGWYAFAPGSQPGAQDCYYGPCDDERTVRATAPDFAFDCMIVHVLPRSLFACGAIPGGCAGVDMPMFATLAEALDWATDTFALNEAARASLTASVTQHGEGTWTVAAGIILYLIELEREALAENDPQLPLSLTNHEVIDLLGNTWSYRR